MIQAFTQTGFTAYIQTWDNRIENGAGYSHNYLYKFTNDISGEIVYCYPYKSDANYPRYIASVFLYNSVPDVYIGLLNLEPAGYWKYEVFEVVWYDSSPVMTVGFAPVTEFDVLTPASGQRGVVKGLVTKGKMFLDEKTGTEEVLYVQQSHSVVKLTIANGGLGYAVAPTILIQSGSISVATATCTIDGLGTVDSVTITNGGSGYTEVPIVSVVGVATNDAQIIAEIENQNYIYTG